MSFQASTGKGRKIMGLPNQDEVKGKYEKAVGTVKENVGRRYLPE